MTADLAPRAGVGRVFDTLLDEQAILGMALGAGGMGCLPIPEVQYLAYLHNAADQIRGEAATLQLFSRGQFRNPMVVRVASYAYQKGFGGHFHNDNSVAALRDIPGVIVASPARGDDAVRMLRTAVAAARVSGSVVLFLEPIARYMTRDLHEEGDGLWTSPYPPPGPDGGHVPIGSARLHGDGGDLTIVTFANGLFMSLRVARRLEARGVRARARRRRDQAERGGLGLGRRAPGRPRGRGGHQARHQPRLLRAPRRGGPARPGLGAGHRGGGPRLLRTHPGGL